MALAVPPAFGWTLGAAIGAGWIGLLLLAAIGSWRALVRKRPLVDFEAPLPRRRARTPDAPPTRRSFGRKRYPPSRPRLRGLGRRSEERRVGQECVMTCICRWLLDH